MTPSQNAVILAAMVGLPAYLVIRFGWRGIFFGAAVMWAIGYLPLHIEQVREPHESLGIAIWITTGWLCGLVYCLFIWTVLWLVRFIRKKTRRSVQ